MIGRILVVQQIVQHLSLSSQQAVPVASSKMKMSVHICTLRLAIPSMFMMCRLNIVPAVQCLPVSLQQSDPVVY